jgi:predicted nucleotidyltransferase
MLDVMLLIKSKDAQALLYEGGVEFAGVFGSHSRGEEKEGSDLDVLIQFKSEDKSLLDLIRLENNLSDLLGKKVDLVTEEALSPLIRDSVFKNLKLVYGER